MKPTRRAFVKLALTCSLLAGASAALVPLLVTPVPPPWGGVIGSVNPDPILTSVPPPDGRRELLRVQDTFDQYRPFVALTPGTVHDREKCDPDRRNP